MKKTIEIITFQKDLKANKRQYNENKLVSIGLSPWYLPQVGSVVPKVGVVLGVVLGVVRGIVLVVAVGVLMAIGALEVGRAGGVVDGGRGGGRQIHRR